MGARAAFAIAAIIGIVVTSTGTSAREVVPFEGRVSAGTVVIKTAERRLYYVRGNGTALRYRVAVGKPGKQWFGEARIDGKYVRPAWSPPAEVKRDNPRLPDVIPGGASNNPMGARALTLDLDEYAIHGTNRPSSIGTYASYGCIRMLNEDIVHLYDQVSVGTRVVVVP
ncbi:L,D-transpeptidase [Microvirga sp. VF16]|uniref:L,D-transpeptidase n=1 Tax=Microvirga sp. VF16 TaxID=2807101 RepID=UPI00193DDA52|nr:L,D-transpeptidase [Microvirga sp. VF16]QRM29774.1 L,D-transpeptidase [Microvirga sp. VF16]